MDCHPELCMYGPLRSGDKLRQMLISTVEATGVSLKTRHACASFTDQSNFWSPDESRSSVLISEINGPPGAADPYNHTPQDISANVDYTYMAPIVTVLANTVASLVSLDPSDDGTSDDKGTSDNENPSDDENPDDEE